MRVLVTGSRDLTDEDLVYDALSDVFADMADDELTVVHGGARGADTFAGSWAQLMRAHYRVFEEKYEADWKQHGKAAGPIRNQEMIDSGIDLVLAFYKTGAANIGTRDMVRKAGIVQVPVTEYTE